MGCHLCGSGAPGLATASRSAPAKSLTLEQHLNRARGDLRPPVPGTIEQPDADDDQAFFWLFEGQNTEGYPVDGTNHLWRPKVPDVQPFFGLQHGIVQLLEATLDTAEDEFRRRVEELWPDLRLDEHWIPLDLHESWKSSDLLDANADHFVVLDSFQFPLFTQWRGAVLELCHRGRHGQVHEHFVQAATLSSPLTWATLFRELGLAPDPHSATAARVLCQHRHWTCR